jgi:hypothetical protein
MGPLPLHTWRRAVEAVLNDILGLHNKPRAVVHLVHKVTGERRRRRKRRRGE